MPCFDGHILHIETGESDQDQLFAHPVADDAGGIVRNGADDALTSESGRKEAGVGSEERGRAFPVAARANFAGRKVASTSSDESATSASAAGFDSNAAMRALSELPSEILGRRRLHLEGAHNRRRVR